MSSFTKLLTMRSALVASVLFLAAHVPTTAAYDEVYNGCYSSSTPLEDQGSYTYQSNGYCQKLCLKDNYAVFALHNKQDCLCGNELPASSDKVSDDECNLSCAGWPSVMCGGANTYSVYLTGIEDDVDNYSSSSTTSSKGTEGTSTSTTQTPTVHAVTSGGQTVYITEAPATHAADASATPTEKSKSSSANTAAIAAGVVVGVVGLCALIGAGFFLWRFKNRKSVEAQYRRSVGVDGYGQPMVQGSDSRFDGDFMAQKRQSNGSIDDDQDFSRRILQVTNPDRR